MRNDLNSANGSKSWTLANHCYLMVWSPLSERWPVITIRITSPKHGLKKGDQLQLIGTTDIDGVFGVQDVRKDSFSLNLKWNNSQIINIQSKPRRGIHFDAVGDAVQTPLLPLSNPMLPKDFARTISAWVYPEDLNKGNQLIAGNEYGLLQLVLIDGIVHVSMNINPTDSDQSETILLADEGIMDNGVDALCCCF